MHALVNVRDEQVDAPRVLFVGGDPEPLLAFGPDGGALHVAVTWLQVRELADALDACLARAGTPRR
jgi:hypothetical protein